MGRATSANFCRLVWVTGCSSSRGRKEASQAKCQATSTMGDELKRWCQDQIKPGLPNTQTLTKLLPCIDKNHGCPVTDLLGTPQVWTKNQGLDTIQYNSKVPKGSKDEAGRRACSKPCMFQLSGHIDLGRFFHGPATSGGPIHRIPRFLRDWAVPDLSLFHPWVLGPLPVDPVGSAWVCSTRCSCQEAVGHDFPDLWLLQHGLSRRGPGRSKIKVQKQPGLEWIVPRNEHTN